MRPEDAATASAPTADRAEVAIIGAGPAGLATAAEASRFSRNVVLIDAGSRVGGQYWRHRPEDALPGAVAPPWHHGWSAFTALREQLEEGIRTDRITHLPGTHVWGLDRLEIGGLSVRMASAQESAAEQQRIRTLHADAVVLAPGAYDRQLPVPGWTVPGVMAAGGIQAFAKTQGIVPGQRILLAGTGPFLLAAAATALHACAEVVAVCESSDLLGWVPRGASAALVPSKAAEGAAFASLLARHRVPYLRRTVITEILGEQQVEAVRVARADATGAARPGTERLIEDVDLVGLGWGFVPQSELLLQSGARTRLDVDGSLVGVVDGSQASTVPGLHLAGEITGVTGAVGAVAEGRIAGEAAAAHALGQSAAPDQGQRAARARHRIFARAMHRAHPAPGGWQSWLREDTTVCRCEDVPYGQIREARDELDLPDPRSLKGETRAGMGPCQGRICGFAMTCLAGATVDPEDAARQVSHRPLALPLTLGALMDDEQTVPDTETGPAEVVAQPLPSSQERA